MARWHTSMEKLSSPAGVTQQVSAPAWVYPQVRACVRVCVCVRVRCACVTNLSVDLSMAHTHASLAHLQDRQCAKLCCRCLQHPWLHLHQPS